MCKIIRSGLGINPVLNETTYCFFDKNNRRFYVTLCPYNNTTINGKYHYYITKDYENGKCIIEEDNVELKEIRKVVNNVKEVK